MVEEIEYLRTELQKARFFAERKVLQKRKIEVVCRCADDDVSSGGSVAAREVAGETGGVKPECRVVVELVRVADSIGTSAGLSAGQLQSGGRIERISRLDRDDAVRLPPAEDRIHESWTRRAELASMSVRQIVGVAGNEAIARIKCGEAPLEVEVGDGNRSVVP